MIRRLVRAFTFSFVFWSPALVHAEGPLALEEAVKLALANHERALKAPLRVNAAEGQLERARAGFLPTLIGVGSGTLDAHQDRTGRSLAGTGTLTLNQPIINPSAYPLYAQARRQLESERWGAVEDRRQLAFDTAHAFLLALANERVLEAATRRLERARADQQDTEARAQAQLNSVNDVTRSSLATSTAASAIAQAQGNVATAYLQLGFLIGRNVSGSLVAPERTTSAAERTAFRLDEMLRAAEARRPDVRSSHELTEALHEFAKEPLYRLAPALAAGAQVRTTLDPLPPDRAYDESVLLTLTWTIFDGGVRYGDRKTRAAQAESQALTEHQLRRSIRTDVNVAIAGLHAARQTYQISDEAVAAAQRNTEETGILYKQGLARAIELTDANAQLYDAEVSRASAKLAMEQAYLQLRLALGFGPVGNELPGNSAAGNANP